MISFSVGPDRGVLYYAAKGLSRWLLSMCCEHPGQITLTRDLCRFGCGVSRLSKWLSVLVLGVRRRWGGETPLAVKFQFSKDANIPCGTSQTSRQTRRHDSYNVYFV